MQDTAIVLLVIAGFAILFPLFWMAIVYLISRVGGWSELAARFGHDGPVTGDVFKWCSARLRVACNYSNCLTVTVCDEGIHIRTLVFFKVGHPPLFIPWTAVRDLKVRRYWRYSSARLILEDPTGNGSPSIVLYGWGLAERLEQKFKQSRSI